ncbi:hypothetical protein CU098_006544 [Rhizopus stolonifer]|uniref:Serine-threonine kinase receptor-associated protein n=1 Tax=Rhizopus stolonifer TaxID=4846 RepID=A0A367IT99_RHIST|nr:hypothetical protein CU098_006544 [Rhizopus stolonifer]
MNNRDLIPLTCTGHTQAVVDLHFSPMTYDRKYYLISASKGDWLGTFKGHKAAVWSARLSKDATKALTSSSDQTARVWSTQIGQELCSLAHNTTVHSAEFNHDDTKVATGGDKSLKIFDLYRPDALPIELMDSTTDIVWDDSRHTLISASTNKIRLWDLRTMRERAHIEACDSVRFLRLSPDGNYVCWAAGHTVNFWKPDSGLEDVKRFETREKTCSVSLHPDHDRFVTASDDDMSVRMYDFNRGISKGHHSPINTISYSPDGELYATGSEDGIIRLWQTNPTKAYGLWQLAKWEC